MRSWSGAGLAPAVHPRGQDILYPLMATRTPLRVCTLPALIQEATFLAGPGPAGFLTAGIPEEKQDVECKAPDGPTSAGLCEELCAVGYQLWASREQGLDEKAAGSVHSPSTSMATSSQYRQLLSDYGPPSLGYTQGAGSSQVPQSKYAELLAIIEELGKEIRPTYAGSKSAMERLKRGHCTAVAPGLGHDHRGWGGGSNLGSGPSGACPHGTRLSPLRHRGGQEGEAGALTGPRGQGVVSSCPQEL
ncbi:Cyclin-dependent kinase 2-associated protein 1 [Tupaia chinensis]|uniref:Cyclin-dependent kinase 2-associated protein 1 n=1 Tax=Tupaia chinensis TaxID=246437 RepID=L9KWG2_TUPCH|nr:Cyclin-dependent kinase 2-associated protein 1 [Tupaia chinensis]